MEGKILRVAELQASVVVPTKDRPDYLRVTLESLTAQDFDAGSYEVVVVDDGPSPETRAVVEALAPRSSAPVRYQERGGVPGLNSARNTGIAMARSDLIVLVDDDVEAPPGWLGELVAGRARHPDALAFGGPIALRLEGSRLPMCGREPPPLTSLDGGREDREIELVWGANMALDRRAIELAGSFDPGVPYGFDEDMWERRLRAAGGRIVYVAGAGLVHRRAPRDARLAALVRESYRRGRALRRYVEHRGDAPSLARELRVLAGCVFHIFRYRCGNGILLAAHSAGRVREYLARG
jgi:glycosyltransferase involved in cell wall biosynthesis